MGLLKNASCSIWSRPSSSDTQLISKEAEPPQKPSQIRLSIFMQLFFSHIHKIHSLMTRDAPIRQPLMISGSYAAFRPVLLISGSGLMTSCKCSAAIGCLSLAEKKHKVYSGIYIWQYWCLSVNSPLTCAKRISWLLSADRYPSDPIGPNSVDSTLW